jgi:hypothetical protein
MRDIVPTYQPAVVEVRPAVDLAALAAEINAQTDAGDAATQRGLEHYRQAGLQLIQAKKNVGHGNWLPWLRANCPKLNERRARRYMELAKSDAASDLTVQWRRISGVRVRPITSLTG